MTLKTKIYWLLILIAVLYCLLSCSPMNRLNRLNKNHPYLFTATTDTLLHRDTIQVVVPGIEMDTVVHYRSLIDTVVIEKNGVTTSVWQKGDTVFVKTKSDTVFINVPYEVKIPYTKYVVQPKKRSFAEKVGLFFIWLYSVSTIVAIIYIIYNKVRKSKK